MNCSSIMSIIKAGSHRRIVPALSCVLVASILQGQSLGKESELPQRQNSIGMTLVRIPAGEFKRGFDTSGRRDHRFYLAHRYSNRQEFKLETPAHQVAIGQAFEIGQTEVTVAQFRRFIEATAYVTDAEQGGGGLGYVPDEKDYVDRFQKSAAVTWKEPGFEQTDDSPVVVVSWNDAQAFCRWLSKEENAEYRLPSEAQWEYACRAGQSSWYSWGEDPEQAYTHANVADGALEAKFNNTTRYQRAIRLGADEGDGFVFTAKVGTFHPNPWGLNDMHGNVWEWCQDRWKSNLYDDYFRDVPRQERDNVLIKNPLFTEKTDQHAYGDWRSMRGGAWTCAPAAVRCSIRTFAEAADATIYTGFRVIRNIPQVDEQGG